MVVTGRLRTSVGQWVGWLCPPWGLGAAERQCGKSKGGGTDGSAWSEPCHIWGACVPKDAGQRPGHCLRGDMAYPRAEQGMQHEEGQNCRGTNLREHARGSVSGGRRSTEKGLFQDRWCGL